MSVDVNPTRFRDRALPVLIIVVGIATVTYGILLLADWFFPSLSAQSGLSLDAIGDSLTSQFTTVANLTGLSVGTDLLLFAAAYVLVCVLLWLQAELRTYFANQDHFQ